MGPQDVSLVVPCFGNRALSFWQECKNAMHDSGEWPYEVRQISDGSQYYEPDGTLVRGFYSLALNDGAQHVESPLLATINCDTLPQPGWLSVMAREFDDPEVAVVGCKLIHPDGSLQHAGVTVRLNGFIGAEEIREDLPTRDVDAVTGACCIMRHSVFMDLGGWDPIFDLGYEDIDFMLRVRDAGHRIRYVQESVVVHHEHAVGADGMRWRSYNENVARFQERWAGR